MRFTKKSLNGSFPRKQDSRIIPRTPNARFRGDDEPGLGRNLLWHGVAVLVIVALLAGCAAVKRAPEAATAKAEPAAKPAVAEPTVPPQWRQVYAHALALMKANRWAEAERELTALMLREPELAGPHANLGIVYQRLGKTADARRALELAIELNPRAAYYNELGMVHRTEGRFDAAERAYRRALQLDADYAYAHLNLGILYDLYLQEPGKALPHYEQYQALAPGEAGTIGKWIADLKRRASQAADQGRGGTSG